jgi:NAD(P)H dehydrogenase (quinone)
LINGNCFSGDTVKPHVELEYSPQPEMLKRVVFAKTPTLGFDTFRLPIVALSAEKRCGHVEGDQGIATVRPFDKSSIAEWWIRDRGSACPHVAYLRGLAKQESLYQAGITIMNPSRPKVLITGATGQIGSAVLRQAVAEKSIHAIAAVRSTEKISHLRVPHVYLDLDVPESLVGALRGIDRAFLATGYTIAMFRQSRDFLIAAKVAGVKHIVHLGAPGGDDTPVDHWLWHQFIERYIESFGFGFTHLRPEIFMQNLLGYGGAKAVDNGVIRHYVGSAKITWIDGEDVATLATAALCDPGRHAGRMYRIGADIKSFAEIAGIMTRIVGKPFTYEARPPEEFLRKVLAAGSNAAYMQSAFDNYVSYSAGKRSGVEELTGTFQEIIGRPPTSIEDFLRKHQSMFAY